MFEQRQFLFVCFVCLLFFCCFFFFFFFFFGGGGGGADCINAILR